MFLFDSVEKQNKKESQERQSKYKKS